MSPLGIVYLAFVIVARQAVPPCGYSLPYIRCKQHLVSIKLYRDLCRTSGSAARTPHASCFRPQARLLCEARKRIELGHLATRGFVTYWEDDPDTGYRDAHREPRRSFLIVMQLVELAEEAYGSLGGDEILADCPYVTGRGRISCGRCLEEALYGIGQARLGALCARRRWVETAAAVSGSLSDSSTAFVGLQSVFSILREPEGGDSDIDCGVDSLVDLVWELGFPRRA